ncbi:helix-turn-helix domain-containing protein [Paenibacillus larvae]|uniref:Putative phage protein n=1 Tax=Paenibacillus larvae subsp. larvae TaxID=147375 RepID=A0A2L1U3U1_9BACL|nr:helix-turn-helix transcriptional regulator [Paenibacillus larvae]AQZ45604.1 hypothetical protein B5S25_02305 [Paenibacillus larvae subsp. pulvifaciens]AVF27613.1 putative phage protein [Paenibacillus larvae subsp. larvae]MBH0344654.1 hypothetical protein [Paenibacillus larvae]MCY7519428.1 helix-turn-helix domain-containing protein [Paenibacillus larvae]MCY9501286.1 helix-turn-helix domain-containing protein [Paenibacillus larvae]
MTNKKAIGLAVKKARKNKGLTQAQVATKSGLSRTYICDVENGRYCPSVDSLLKIAGALGVTADDVLGSL